MGEDLITRRVGYSTLYKVMAALHRNSNKSGHRYTVYLGELELQLLKEFGIFLVYAVLRQTNPLTRATIGTASIAAATKSNNMSALGLVMGRVVVEDVTKATATKKQRHRSAR